MISVVISTFNRSAKLKRAIESVLAQTYTDFEIIVVDDASTDDTEQVVLDLIKNSPNITYIHRQTSFGCDTKGKNEGILASKGEYISLLDDDNTFRPDHLAVLIKEMEKNPELDMVYGDRFIFKDDQPLQLGITGDYDEDRFKIFARNFIDTSDVLIKRECIFDMGGFDERFKKFIDWNLWVRMTKAGKRIKRVPIVITNYYISTDSKSLRKEDSKGDTTPGWDPLNCEVRLDYLGKKPEPKVAIFSLTHDRLEYTKKAFETLYATADYPFEHVVVDNGSTDGTVDWLKEDGYHTIFNEENKGIAIASNQAIEEIRKGDYDIIIKYDNDCYAKTDGWLRTMVRLNNIFPTMVLSLYVEGLKDNPGGAPRQDYLVIGGELIGVTNHIGGICHFVEAKAYDNFRWDEDSFLHGVQDVEFSQYLLRNGYVMGYLENMYCSHGPGTELQQAQYPEYFEKRKYEKTHRYEKSK